MSIPMLFLVELYQTSAELDWIRPIGAFGHYRKFSTLPSKSSQFDFERFAITLEVRIVTMAAAADPIR